MTLRRAQVLFLGFCAACYIYANVLAPMPGLASPSDFTHYYLAGGAILHLKSPFDDPEFLYPPLVAFLFAPFALLSYVAARWAWFLTSQACLIAAAVILWHSLKRNWTAALCIALTWGLTSAGSETLALGQITPLLVLLLAIAYSTAGAAQGVSVATGFSLKYIPGSLAIALLLRRDLRAVAAFVFTAVVLVSIPWIAIAAFFSGARAPVSGNYWMGTPAILSWSIPSAVLRALDPPATPDRVPHDWEFGNTGANLHLSAKRRAVSLTISAATFAGGVLALTLACRGRLRAEQMSWALAGLTSLSLAASPVCWTHYQLLQYPGLALLLANAVQQRRWRSAAGVVVCGALLYAVPVLVLTNYYRAHAGWSAASPFTLYFWTSVAPLASLAVFAFCLWNLWCNDSVREVTGCSASLPHLRSSR